MTDIGSYVKLLEYNNIRGLIPTTEYSRKRIRSIQKIINVGKVLAAEVINVDIEKGFIDLSKKSCSLEEIDECYERYYKACKVQSIVRRLALTALRQQQPAQQQTHEENEENEENEVSLKMLHIYQSFVWSWYDLDHGSESRGPYEVLKALGTASTDVDYTKFPFSFIPTEYRELLTEVCRSTFVIHPFEVIGRVHLVHYGFEGIELVKRMLQKLSELAPRLVVRYITQSTYAFSMMTTKLKQTQREVNQCMRAAVTFLNRHAYGPADSCIEQLAIALLSEKERTRVFEVETNWNATVEPWNNFESENSHSDDESDKALD